MKGKGKPLTPDEVIDAKMAAIPPEVFDVVNQLIADRWDGFEAILYQDEIVERLVTVLKLPSKTIFDRHLLDFEGIYRNAGWGVVYDKPAYNESYRAFFRFSKLRRH